MRASHLHSSLIALMARSGWPSAAVRTISTDPRHPGLPVLDPVPAYSPTGRELDLVLLPPVAQGDPSVAASKAAK